MGLEGAEEGEQCPELETEGEPLDDRAKGIYQTQAARANYLCLDRPDIGFATKETMRKLSNPTTEDEIALMKLGFFCWVSQN